MTVQPLRSPKVPAGKSGKLPEVCYVPGYISQNVIAAVCDKRACAINERLVCGASRKTEIAQARFMVFFILRAAWGDSVWTGESAKDWATFPQIGRVLYREYTTVMHAYSQAKELIHTSANYRRRLVAALDLLAPMLPMREFQRVMLLRERIAAL